MKHKNDKSISLVFLLFITISIIGIIVYSTYPNPIKKIKKNITYEELLEKSENSSSTVGVRNEYENLPPKKENITTTINSNQNIVIKNSNIDYRIDNNFKTLLDELKKYPSNSAFTANIITEKILKYLGYEGYEVKVKNMSKDGAKPINSTKTAYFDIAEGVLYLNQDLVSKLKVQELTSTIAHELDHFDKIAKICKSIGTEKFFKLTEKNNFIITNKEFWIKASKKANLTNFDISLYENALERFINKNRLKTSSVYADINVISELLRNPLETSAYELSNYILDYFNINKKENETQKLANQFNETDWAIYNITSKDNSLRNERIALFDYLLMQTIVKNNSKYTSIVNKCKSTNGDLTPFWNEFKKDNNDFFDENIPTQKETYSYIINLLKEVETNAKSGLSSNNIAEAVKLYVYTLLTDIKYKDSVSRIKTSVEDYINYTKDNNIENPKDLLKMYLILICLENNLNKDKTKEIPSLYYLKIPTLLLEENESNKKNKRYNFIYKNSEFITELNKQKQIDTNTTEQKLLTEMIVKTASEIK